MTTLVRPDAPADGGGGQAPERPHEPSRYATWRSSWAVALRMARRDVRRHKGRSALIVVMVTVPTLLLSALVTIAATSDVSGPSCVGPTMGTGQALLGGPRRRALRRARRRTTRRASTTPRVRSPDSMRTRDRMPTPMPCPSSSAPPWCRCRPSPLVPRSATGGSASTSPRSTVARGWATSCGWSRGGGRRAPPRPWSRRTACPAGCPTPGA